MSKCSKPEFRCPSVPQTAASKDGLAKTEADATKYDPREHREPKIVCFRPGKKHEKNPSMWVSLKGFQLVYLLFCLNVRLLLPGFHADGLGVQRSLLYILEIAKIQDIYTEWFASQKVHKKTAKKESSRWPTLKHVLFPQHFPSSPLKLWPPRNWRSSKSCEASHWPSAGCIRWNTHTLK